MSNTKFNAEEKLTIARVQLQKRFPFYGYLALKLKVIEKPEVGTAGVDGKGNMYYNPEFIEGLNTDQLIFLWGHEIGHLIFEHVALKGTRDHQLWNMAGDYAINLLLVNDKCGTFIEGGLLEKKYENWTAAAIYDDLIKDAEQNKKKYEDASGKDNHDMWGDMTPEEAERTARQWQQAAISAAHAVKSAGGQVPEAFRGLIDALTESKISWRDLIREKIRSHNREDVSWSRINRHRSLGSFNYPGKKPGEKVSFMVAIDVSGSFTQDMVTDAMSEVYAATREFVEVDVEVIQWDTRVYGHRHFNQDQGEEMLQYKIEGGGGTDVNCVIDWMRENNKEPAQLFVFTDLYFSFPEDPLICPTTFIVIGNDNITPPWGESIKYD